MYQGLSGQSSSMGSDSFICSVMHVFRTKAQLNQSCNGEIFKSIDQVFLMYEIVERSTSKSEQVELSVAIKTIYD